MEGEHVSWLVDGFWMEEWFHYKMSRDGKDLASYRFSHRVTIVNKILNLAALDPYKFISLSIVKKLTDPIIKLHTK